VRSVWRKELGEIGAATCNARQGIEIHGLGCKELVEETRERSRKVKNTLRKGIFCLWRLPVLTLLLQPPVSMCSL